MGGAQCQLPSAKEDSEAYVRGFAPTGFAPTSALTVHGKTNDSSWNKMKIGHADEDGSEDSDDISVSPAHMREAADVTDQFGCGLCEAPPDRAGIEYVAVAGSGQVLLNPDGSYIVGGTDQDTLPRQGMELQAEQSAVGKLMPLERRQGFAKADVNMSESADAIDMLAIIDFKDFGCAACERPNEAEELVRDGFHPRPFDEASQLVAGNGEIHRYGGKVDQEADQHSTSLERRPMLGGRVVARATSRGQTVDSMHVPPLQPVTQAPPLQPELPF